MKKEPKEIKVKVTIASDLEKRYTAACLEAIKRREVRREDASA